VLVLWLYGTLLLAERQSGHVIMLVGALLALGILVINLMGAGGIFHREMARYSGAFLFFWTLIMLGVTGMFFLILEVRGLWTLERGRPGSRRMET
jgi:hypothetical protein